MSESDSERRQVSPDTALLLIPLEPLREMTQTHPCQRVFLMLTTFETQARG